MGRIPGTSRRRVKPPGRGDTLEATKISAGFGYMAPEQVRGDPLDRRADLFALGLTLHEALTGEPTLRGNNQAQLMTASLNQELLPPSHSVPGISRALDSIIMGLLQHDLSRRTPSGDVLQQQLLALTGPEAPLPQGRRQLIELVSKALSQPAAPPLPMADAFATKKMVRTCLLRR